MVHHRVHEGPNASDGMQVCVCGGGNAAHVMVGDLRTQRVNVYAPFADEAERLASQPEGWIVAQPNEEDPATSDLVAKPARISKNPEDVIPGCKVVFLPLPIFAQEPTLRSIAKYVDSDAVVVALPGTGGFDWMAHKVFKEAGLAPPITAGFSTLPYTCRISEFGKKVSMFSKKDLLNVCVSPASKSDYVRNIMEDMLHIEFHSVPSYLCVTLNPTNPIMHPGRCYGLFEGKEAHVFPEMQMFYDGCDDKSNDTLVGLDKDNQAIVQAYEKAIPGCLNGYVLPLTQYLKSVYADDMPKWGTPMECYHSNVGFHGVGSPMKQTEAKDGWVADFKNRYFSEDIPFGIMANKGLAVLAGVPTPTMDKVILWAQKHMGRKFINTDGSLNPEEKSSAPEYYGLDMTDLQAMYNQDHRND